MDDQLPTESRDIFQRMEPRSLINLVSPQIQNAMIEAYAKVPELFGLDERDLFKRLRTEGLSPSPTDNRIRLAFWMEYDRCQSLGEKFKSSNVYASICSQAFFHLQYLTKPSRVAWLITAPVGYNVKMEEALDYGLDRLREYLEIDPRENGRLNVKLMELQAKIVAMFELRVKGGIVQRTESKTLNLHVGTTDSRLAHAHQEVSMDALEKRLKVIESMERSSLNLPATAPVEVDSEPQY